MRNLIENESGNAVVLNEPTSPPTRRASTRAQTVFRRIAFRPLTSLLPFEPRIGERPNSLEIPITRARSCKNLFMPEYENCRKIPQRTTELLDSLVRASASGSKVVELNPYFSTPIACRADVAPILPSSRCFIEFMLTQKLDGQTILDFGSGTGILAVMARKLRAGVVDAIDINPAAVLATTDNARRFGFAEGINVKQSDGFAAVNGRYDLVLANLPMVDADSYAGVLFGLFDPHFELHRHFFANLHRHLQPGGSAIICHSEFQEDWPFTRLESLAAENGLTAKLVFEQTVENVEWQLYRITPADPAK